MSFSLGPRACEAGYRLAAYDTIGSTSGEASARAEAGDPGRLWVVSAEQSAGHGRRGRPWQTPRGNLAASLLVGSAGSAATSATLGFAAGLALERAIRTTAPSVAFRLALDAGDGGGGRRVMLKWPNDVLIDGAKVAGLLLEGVTTGGEARAVVIGIGVNVVSAPEGLPYPATSLAACGAEVTAETLFQALAEAWVEQQQVWNAGRGFAAIREEWLKRAAGLGAPIAVKVGDDVFRGTFETIDDEGRLIVRAGDGSARTIAAGDVHFGAVATAH